MTPSWLAVERGGGVVTPIRCPHCRWRQFDANFLAPGQVITIKCQGCRRLVTFVGCVDGAVDVTVREDVGSS